ncbi:hypothetical protein BDV12DRAFT_211199 [Aspergillus spectabilis]
MAGIVPSPDAISFLNRFDRAAHIPLGIAAPPVKSSGYAHPIPRGGRLMTSCGALYFRLRANFHGLSSAYLPHPPEIVCLDGESLESAQRRAIYESEQRVIDIREDAEDGSTEVLVVVQNVVAGQIRTLSADLVLGADGANSFVGRKFLGDIVSRKYAGYVAWRGVVPEILVSEETREAFRANRPHAARGIEYTIPGDFGTLEPGSRNINFIWYNPIAASALPTVMTDKLGTLHRTTVPQDLIDPSIWSRQVSLGASLLPPPYFEILSKITSPFIHLITDYTSPRASFLNGRVLLVGDAHTLLRPHIGYSTSMAAMEARLMEQLVAGDSTINDWDYRVTTMAYLHWCRGIWFGESFVRPGSIWGTAASAVWYWGVVGWYRVKSYWNLLSSRVYN